MKIINLTKEQISKIKTYGLAIAIVLVVGLGVFSLKLSKDNKESLRELSLERDRYGLLAAEKARLDSLEVIRLEMIKERDEIIDLLKTKYSWRMAEVKKLKDSLVVKNAQLELVSSDSSYKYINQVYPPISIQKYPLDSLQIKTFHVVDINLQAQTTINKNLDKAVEDLETLNNSYFLQIGNYKNLYEDKKYYADILDKDNTMLTNQLKRTVKEANKQKALKNVTGSAFFGTAIALLVVLL